MLIDLSQEVITQIMSALRYSGLEFTKNKEVYDKLEKYIDDEDMF